MSRFKAEDILSDSTAVEFGRVAWETARDGLGTESERAISWESLGDNDRAWWVMGAFTAFEAGRMVAVMTAKLEALGKVGS